MHRRKRSSFPPAWLPPLVVAALGALGAFFVRHRRAAAAESHTVPPGSPPSQAPATQLIDQEWACECGQAYRVSGEGRHRIYWLPDAPVSDPIIDGRCVSCERELPGDQPAPAASGDEQSPATG